MLRRRSLVVFGLALLTACGQGGASSDAEESSASEPSASAATAACLTVDAVKEKGGWDITIEVPDWEPYWFADEDGDYIGMDVDMLNEVNSRLGIDETRYNPIPWEGVLPAQLSGASDFLPEAITITEERQGTFAFSHPYGDASIVIMTTPDSGISGEGDLVGKTVGIQTGSAAEQAALALQEKMQAEGDDFGDLNSYQNPTDQFLDLGNGRIDAVLSPRPPVGAYMSKHPGEFTVAGVTGDSLLAGWVFRPDDMEGPGCIGYEINALLSDFREEGLITEWQEKWFGEEIPLPSY